MPEPVAAPKRTFTVALDGPAAAGKGTIGRALSERFGLAYLDTGLLYRAVGARTAAGEDPFAAARTLSPEDLRRPDLRSAEAGQAASEVAALPEVRATLLEFQRSFAGRPGGAVLDGRDIGTVVCPGAPVKLFVTASPETRARRRHEELLGRGEESIYAHVLTEMQARDARDRDRAVAPLRPATDAVILDTTALDAEAAYRAALEAVAVRTGRVPPGKEKPGRHPGRPSETTGRPATDNVKGPTE